MKNWFALGKHKMVGAALLLLLVVILFGFESVEAQCPMCKAAVESGTDYGAKDSWLASMLNTGILYLFALPYLVIMGVGILWYRGYKRRKREEAQSQMTTIDSVLGTVKPGNDEIAT
ncbi:MAG: hypothetical protein AAGN35_04715 [Bacteroidota bacterium]